MRCYASAATSTRHELPTAPNINLDKLQLTCSLASATFFSSSEPSTLDLEEILVVVDKMHQLTSSFNQDDYLGLNEPFSNLTKKFALWLKGVASPGIYSPLMSC